MIDMYLVEMKIWRVNIMINPLLTIRCICYIFAKQEMWSANIPGRACWCAPRREATEMEAPVEWTIFILLELTQYILIQQTQY